MGSLIEDVASTWEIDILGRPVVTLAGGDESDVTRVGSFVVRVGPSWRPIDEAEWCYRVADSISGSCPPVVPPVRTPSGRAVVAMSGRPVSVWPYIDGRRGDRTIASDCEQAAAALADLHRAANSLSVEARPPLSAPITKLDTLTDPALDQWFSEFTTSRRQHPIHGDFYPGNTLFSDGALAGIVDWDEASIGAPEIELAVAACEWGNVFRSGDLTGALEFVGWYVDEGGTADDLDLEEIAQLYRVRLRWEMEYEEYHSGSLGSLDDDDRTYRLRQLELYNDLRP